MNGTPSQIEWAERIKVAVGEEFDRVVNSFRSVGLHQGLVKRKETDAIISILEEKRESVMTTQEAGYFIRYWQEISDQIQQLIGARISASKTSRRGAPKQRNLEAKKRKSI